MTAGGSELEGDADSLACGQSGLSTIDQLENDCNKLVLHYLQRIVFIIFESTVIHGQKRVCQIPSWTWGLRHGNFL